MSPGNYLSQVHLGQLGADVRRPAYGRATLRPGIVHFGPGAFHRAHQAWFVDRLLADDDRWSICGVSLRSPDVRDALAPQDGLYTLATLDEKISYQVIGALREILVAPEDPENVLNRLSAPTTRVVTITVTEKGYCLDANGSLDTTHTDIQRDLRLPQLPTSLIGYLVEGLRRRRAAGSEPLTIISCDNLTDNGTRLSRAVCQLAELRDPSLVHWIEDHASFPRTMVDSITPATTDALRERVKGVLGMEDRWPVQRESFAQWVLEDRLAVGGPDWASAGVIITDDVAAYDQAKLRLLNGSHSSLAYLGLLAGYETVADAMRDERLCSLVTTMMKEDVRPTLRTPRGLDLDAYIDVILRRFRNPAIRHALAQIAWDGSQKLPFRLLGTISDNLEAGRPIERLCIPVAGWMHFVRRQAARGERVTDPLSERLFEVGGACENRARHDVPAFLGLDSVFPASLVREATFRNGLAQAYDELAIEG
ncbi:MAG TPA: mannitol dehydrogenase family protein [Steroidobacteraceae bacterium]|nr:mannitol dehydrogenase family protein [Steroidobacteraceae bacterium]